MVLSHSLLAALTCLYVVAWCPAWDAERAAMTLQSVALPVQGEPSIHGMGRHLPRQGAAVHHGYGEGVAVRPREARPSEWRVGGKMGEKRFAEEATRLAIESVEKGWGGPFGAVIVKDGEIIGR